MKPLDGSPCGRTGASVSALFLALALAGCGSSPARFDPGIPDVPAGVTVVSGNRRVTVTWPAARGASAYRVYTGTAPGVTQATATLTSGIVTSTSYLVTGLSNGTTYWFAVSAISSSGESALSAEASATPAPSGPYAPADLLGTWRFDVLSAGVPGGWSRGTLSVDDAGATIITAYADSAGVTTAPSGFLARLLIDDAGRVRDGATPEASVFTGVLAPTNRTLIVLSSAAHDAPALMILQLHTPTIAFGTSDLAGFGGGTSAPGGGSRKFAFDQITTGPSPQEWGFACGQIGKNAPLAIQYTNSASSVTVPLPYLTASEPAGAAAPADKATTMGIDAAGVATETLNPAITTGLPDFVLPAGFMTDDKTTLFGVGSTRGTPPRQVLRVYHLMNLVLDDAHALSIADLAGSWAFEQLVVGDAPRSASGSLQIDAAGTATFGPYADSVGGAAPPSVTLAMDTLQSGGVSLASLGLYGLLTSPQDGSLHGKLSYFGDLLVLTRTESSFASSFLVAVR